MASAISIGWRGWAAGLALALAAQAGPAAAADQADIVLAFQDMQNVGQVLVALYDSEASYKQRAHPVRHAAFAVRDGRAEAAFHGLPPGAYAAMVFHDLNGDQRMNFRFGLPAEPYAITNNAHGFPIASWGAAKFEAPAGETRQAIRLK